MPKATRLGDKCTGHDSCAPKALISGSADVFFNKKKAGRVSDKYDSHGCDVHSSHQDEIKTGSGTVFINGLPVARVGDEVTIGGVVAEGSDDIYIGG